jgi:hypothetical protein
LKAGMTKLEQTVAAQKSLLGEKYKDCIQKSKAFDDERAVFRDELIKIKKERSKLEALVKSFRDENDKLKLELGQSKDQVKVLERDMTKKVKKHNDEVGKLDKEIESLKKNLAHSRLFEQSNVKEISTQTDNLGSQNKNEASTQTSEVLRKVESSPFEEYKCFYCGFLDKSEIILSTHLTLCGQSARTANVRNISKPQNEKVLNVKEAFEQYLNQYQKISSRKYQCDICQQIFDSEMLLGLHKMGTHYPG